MAEPSADIGHATPPPKGPDTLGHSADPSKSPVIPKDKPVSPAPEVDAKPAKSTADPKAIPESPKDKLSLTYKDLDKTVDSALGRESYKASMKLLADLQPKIWNMDSEKGMLKKAVFKIKTLLGPIFGIKYGLDHPAVHAIGYKMADGTTYTAIPAFQALGIEALPHMVREALEVGLGAGSIGAGVQIATDAIRVLGLKENHRHLLVRSLMRSGGLGKPEAWMMRQIGLGDRGHVDQLARWGEQIKQGMFPKEFINKHYKSVVKVIMSSYDAMAGVQAVELLGSDKVKAVLMEKEGQEGGYLDTIKQAFYTGQKMINDFMTPEQRNEFLKNFGERMKLKTMKKTAMAVLARGGSQIVRIGPWALGASLLTGIYHGIGIDKFIHSHVKTPSFLSDFYNKFRYFGAPSTPNVLPTVYPDGSKIV